MIGESTARTPLRLAVIGGGYTGAAFVIHAIRASRRPLILTVIDPAETLGRGVAYSTTDRDHRINVPTDRMSLFGEDPTHATRWLFDHGALPDTDSTDHQGHHYVPRHAFGGYVAAMLAATVAAAGARVRFEHRRATALDVRRTADAWSVEVSHGAPILADGVIACFGHAAPAWPCAVSEAVQRDRRFVPNPWVPDAFRPIDPACDVLIVGTGLTMADVVASLTRRGHCGSMTAISRRALLPRPQGLFSDPHDILQGAPVPRTALGLLRLLRKRIASADDSTDWHTAVDALRACLPKLWPALPAEEKRKVVRRLLPFWEVHRFRIGPQVHAALDKARCEGALRIEQAALAALDQAEDGLVATFRTGASPDVKQAFGAVVLCTGPEKDLRKNPLVARLLHHGLVRIDDVGSGLATNAESRLLDRDGRAQPDLIALGPMTRGSFGEMTGAPDITRHIERVVPGIVA